MKAIVLLKNGFKGFLVGVILMIVCFAISLTTAAVAFVVWGGSEPFSKISDAANLIWMFGLLMPVMGFIAGIVVSIKKS